MIKIIFMDDPENKMLSMRAEGHAGFAPAGQDVVCAAVSCLMQTLAYSASEEESTAACCYQGKDGPVVNVQAADSEATAPARYPPTVWYGPRWTARRP